MKKQLLILTILFLTITDGQGQTNIYHPFPDSSAIWRENCNGPGASLPPDVMCNDYENYLTGDTIIGIYNYEKVWQLGSHWITSCATYVYSWDQYVGAIRQDTIQKKVFYLPPSQINETLLYDFNLLVGDTLSPSEINDSISTKNFVSSIDSVLIGNSFRKRFWISCQFGSDYVALIEGIGSTYGLLNDLAPPFEWQCQLLCYTQNGNSLYPDTIPNCGVDPVNVLEQKNIIKLTIFPNPFYLKTTLQTNKFFKDATMTVYNAFGQQVKQIKNISGQTIIFHRDNLPSGIYFIRLTQENKIIATDKLIIID